MPRRVFTYPAGLGFETLNLVVDDRRVRPRRRDRGGRVGRRAAEGDSEPYAPRNPWNAGTLEWLQEMPGQPWGMRSIPEIDSRYPLWDQPTSCATSTRAASICRTPRKAAARCSSPRRIDAEPVQCLRLAGPTLHHADRRRLRRRHLHLPDLQLYGWMARQRGVLARRPSSCWLWTGTGEIPEKERRTSGSACTLPLYVSGRDSVGWWAMFITHAGDLHRLPVAGVRLLLLLDAARGFRARPGGRPGVPWPAARLGAARRLRGPLTALARRWNAARSPRRRSTRRWPRPSCSPRAGIAALIAGPWTTGLDPVAERLRGDVWLLVIWTRAARRPRHRHAALLRRAPARRPHDRAPRHGHRQRHALLALHRGDRR